MMILDKLIKLLPSKPIFAHCDVPCGIYDPHQMQMAAHTVLRMTQLFLEAHQDEEGEAPHKLMGHQIFRCTLVKEQHAEIVKHEVRVLWGDYFKKEHLEKFPELPDLVWQTLKLASKTKQSVDLDDAKTLLENTQKIAEIFWQTKGFEPIRIPSGYPTEGEIVTHK